MGAWHLRGNPPFGILSVEGLVRVSTHEALRLFQDRLVTEEKKQWTNEHIGLFALEPFPTINRDETLHRPILFSNWTLNLITSLSIEKSFTSIRRLACAYSMRKNSTYR